MVKNLLFDLGGVIMDIRRTDCIAAFKSLGMDDPERFLGEYSQAGPFGDLESGYIDEAGFYAALRPYLPKGVTDPQIRDAFNAFLVGIPETRLDALKSLRKKYKVYLLSNTNPIMWNTRIAEEFAKQGGSLADYTDGVILSFEEKCMKPDPQIFKNAVRKLGIKPQETVFLDDSKLNTEAAAALGFRTIHVAPGTEFVELLKENGCD